MARLHEGNEAFLTVNLADDHWNIIPVEPSKVWKIRINDNSYNKTCLPLTAFKSGTLYPGTAYFNIIYTNWGPGAVNITFLSMQYINAANIAQAPHTFIARKLPDGNSVW